MPNDDNNDKNKNTENIDNNKEKIDKIEQIEKQLQEDVHITEELVEAIGPEAEKETKGVKTLLGDPKKAIIILSIPMIISMLLSSSYNFIDGI